MYQVNFLPWRQRRDRRRGCFWLGVLLLQITVLLLAGGLVAGQLRHQQAQRQERLALLEEELAAVTLLVRQQQQERAQRARYSALAERQARNAQHNRRYLQLLQQLSSCLPPTAVAHGVGQRCGERPAAAWIEPFSCRHFAVRTAAGGDARVTAAAFGGGGATRRRPVRLSSGGAMGA